MKTITTITLLLCSIIVYGQKPKGLTSGSSRGTYTRDTTKSFNPIIHGQPAFMSDYYTIKPTKLDCTLIISANKTVIKVSTPDSTGLVKVWINKKEITWTSDSTFIYKTEQK